MLESWGVRPDFLVGHSVGEFAAAHVSGVLGLNDACRLVVARGRLMAALPEGGVMVAVEASEDEVAPHLGDAVALAAVNSPRAVVLSGEEAAVLAATAELAERGHRVRRLSVSHAFHSPLMAPARDGFRRVLDGVAFGAPTIPVVSSVTGAVADLGNADYWVEQVVEPVRFADAVRAVVEDGGTTLVELGPDTALVNAALVTAAGTAGVEGVALLRRDRDEVDTARAALARLVARGVEPDWRALLPDGRVVPLPTYAFARQRFWPRRGSGAVRDVSAAGLRATGHPLLGAVLDLPDGGGAVLTGRFSLRSQPWLADHAVGGAVLLPGAAFVDLVLRAGEEVGCDRIAELVVEAPLVLPEDSAVQLRVVVDADRAVTVHARPDDGGTWTRHATGRLAEAAEPVAWSDPVGEPLPVDDLYDRLAAGGFSYGPAFRALTGARRTDSGVAVELDLTATDAPDAGFRVHPSLLDAALHAVPLLGLPGLAGLPFTWTDVTAHAPGAVATRALVEPVGPDSVSVRLADADGEPVLTVAGVMLRAAGAQAAGDLLETRWRPVRAVPPLGRHAVLGDAAAPGAQGTSYADADELWAALGAGDEVPATVFHPLPVVDGPVPEAVRVLVADVLALLQDWQAEPAVAHSRLVVVTRAGDLAHAAVRGLVRTAGSEAPGRFALVDSDGSADLPSLPDEPEVAVRDGRVLVPRLARAAAGATTTDLGDTVLVTGASGALGGLVARHLVAAHGVRHLVLASRTGRPVDVEGADVVTVACDVADRDALAALLAEHPVTAVVHAAGVLDDGVLDALTPERFDAVLRPKVDAAHHLHELTDVPLVLFSSAAGVLGAAGQGNYAAANAFLDALAEHRRAAGLPAVSLAWGAWTGGMAGELDEAARARMARAGLPPLTVEQGLELFDAALTADRAALLPLRLDTAALRALDEVPPLLRDLVPARRAAARRANPTTRLGRDLAGRPPAEQERALLAAVSSAAAHVLGHADASAVPADRTFQELGFDSLTAIDLRNRLDAATGLTLPPTLVFDHPTPLALAAHLRAELVAAPAPVREAPRTVVVSDDPVVIVGMGCRYPGGITSPEELWDLVARGGDGIGDFPADRGWDVDALHDPDRVRPGTSVTREGGFLHDAAEFDPAFFGMSPREALGTDPQQRLLLEVSWEAVERAGIDPVSLRGSRTGVFAGVMYNDYGLLAQAAAVDSDTQGNGSSGSVATGRVAYTMGLEGPAVTVDTACSSSLVALHWAAQALRGGECDLALAGGVTVMATPTPFVEFSRQGGLAPDGRCKAFSDAADGTGWSEGAGVLLLERLSDARRNGHTVLAVVKGSAVNSDGASNGLTAPNGPSQQRVIRQALDAAGLTPSDVDVVEAHGTGTVLGDPIEAQALLATYGQDRDEPLLLGSIKSNIGHTQAAAGVAGIIKVVEAMRHGAVPRTLHVTEPSSHVDWASGAVDLVVDDRAWPAVARPRRAAVSSFGISGTNAHVIIEQPAPSPSPTPTAPAEGPFALAVSARDRDGARTQAAHLADHLRATDDALADTAFSLATTRAALEHRVVVVAADRAEAADRLAAFAADGDAPGVVEGEPRRGGLAFAFAGQGSQRARMGLGLDRYPVFAAALDEVAAVLDAESGWSLRDALAHADLDRTGFAQPALFAVEVALFRLLDSWGVRPDVLVGHSVGEIAAAHVAGVFSLADACRLVVARANLMQALPAGGAMVAVRATEAEVRPLLDDGVSIAAVNGPASLVVAGPEDAVLALAARLGDKATRLRVSHAFHSALMDPVLDDFRRVLDGIAFAAPRIAHEPTADGEWDSPGYWVRQVRDTVRFADAVTALAERGVSIVLEVGPGAALSAAVRENADVVAVPLLRGDDEPTAAVTALGRLHAAGAPVDLTAPTPGARRVALPTTAFRRRRFWPVVTGAGLDLAAAGVEPTGHALLAAAVGLADSDSHVFTARLSLSSHPWLAEHRMGGLAVLPGSVFVELAVRAGDEVGFGGVRELMLVAPLVVPESGGVTLQVRVDDQGAPGARAVTVHSRREDGGDWSLHATGVLTALVEPAPEQGVEWPPAGAEQLSVEDFHADVTRGAGGEYGPLFRGLRSLWRRDGEVFAEVVLPGDARTADGFGLHPALLDAVVQALSASSMGGDEGRLPFAWADLRLHAAGATSVRARITPTGPDSVAITVVDPTGAPVLTAGRLTVRSLADVVAPDDSGLMRVEWHAVEPAAGAVSAAVVGDVVDVPGATRHPDVAAVLAAGAPDVTVLPVVPEGDDPATAARQAAATALDAVRTWLAEAPRGARLALVTRGTGPAEAGVWGLVRSAQTEAPDRLALVDLDGPADLLPAAVATGEPQLALRGGVPGAARLVRAGTPGKALDLGDTVLVTGGTGGLGLVLAHHLVTAHGVRDLVLTGRRGADAPGVAEAVAELTAAGARVVVTACDVADRDRLAAVLADVPGLTGVVHAAGVLDDGVIAAQTPERLATAMRPKADGAWHLHELLPDTPLVLFSSLAGVLGAAGQANYAAGNAFVDALAAHRRAEGKPVVSIAWGAWALPAGMAGGMSAADRQRLARAGMPPMTRERGLAWFDAALTAGDPAVVAQEFAVRTLRTLPSVPPLLRALAPAVVRRTAAAHADRAAFAGLSGPDLVAALLEAVRGHVAAVLGHPGTVVGADRAFRDLGFDSLTGVELRNRLDAATGLTLPSTLVFDHPTPRALAGHLAAEIGGSAPVLLDATPRTAEQADDPVVIVGMGCRYPGGVRSPEDLWRLVSDGVDAITGFPADRGWDVPELRDPDEPEFVRAGGFLRDAADFDAGFFGIAPREALAMDPQQRLLLETAWESLETAGIDPVGLRGDDVGVFVGAGGQDYAGVLLHSGIDVAAHLNTGNAGSVLSGRLSYALGLVGPAVTVDTACSSSLVALHLAAQSLRSGECSLALAGGVTVMSTPLGFVTFSRQGGLAPDGRCKAFSADADGTAWAEGVGVLVLERLSDARRNGHEVLAVVRGSAVNQDGASNGLTAPNGPSQQRVIRAALANAGLRPSEVDVVEAHGTGTPLGDPIEAQALLATYGRDRQTPLLLGSVKSNIGHAQAAAGVAGIIKVVEAMRHGVVPRTLHVTEPTGEVDWSTGAVELAAENVPWPDAGRVRRAAVSSFGISGTNAHTVLEQAPPAGPLALPDLEAPVDGAVPWVLSGRTEAALRAQAARLAAHLDDHDPAAVGAALLRRTRFDHRAVVLGDDRAGALAALARGESHPGLVRGTAADRGPVVFVFPGQGGQWVGMARELVAGSPEFADRMHEVDAALSALVPWSLFDVLGDADALERVDVVQPALFAVMVSLAHTWRALGVEPAGVVGHSQGEIAAACASGALSLEDAVRVVVLRSRAIAEVLEGRGGMASVALSRGEVEPLLERFAGRAVVAAVNGPRAVVLSGDVDALDDLVADLVAREVRARRIPVGYASHWAGVDAVEERVLADLAGVAPVSVPTGFYSGLRGAAVDTADLDAGYWFRSLRERVDFAGAARAAADAGADVFVEVGPHPVLSMSVRDIVGDDAVVVGSLRRGEGGADRLLRSVAEAWVAGVPVRWEVLCEGVAPAALPTYAFQHERFWPPMPEPTASKVDDGFLAGLDPEMSVGDALALLARPGEAGDNWLYRVAWRPVPRVDAPPLSGDWLVLVPADDPDPAWTARVAPAGAVVALDTAAPDRAGYAAALPAGRYAGVLSLLGADERPYRTGAARGLAATLALVQALGDAGITAPLWCATRAAHAVTPAERAGHPAQAAVWGLGRVVALEHPERWGGLLDLPADAADLDHRDLAAVLDGSSGEDQVALRRTGPHGRRFEHAPPVRVTERAEPPATALVTGGTGALGAHVARWLAGEGARHLVLTSRRGPDAPGADELRADLEALGARVTIVACDVSDRTRLAAVLDGIGDDCPLTDVVHTAAALDDAMVDALTPERVDEVLAVKALGAWHLHELTRDRDLTSFVLFASIAGVFGVPGQGNYAPGNAYLDALAEHRAALGLPALSVAWGPWGEGGMAEGEVGRTARRHGFVEMDPDVAVVALRTAMAGTRPALAVADVEWERFGVAFTASRPSPFVADLPEVRALAARVAPAPDDAGFAATLTALPAAERVPAALALVRDRVAATLGFGSAADVQPRTPFRDLGTDSVTALELRNLLNAATGLRLATTVVFDHTTPQALAEHVVAELTGSGADREGAAVAAADGEPIAIVGMACRFPGGVSNPAQLWDLLASGGDAITGPPADRGWKVEGIAYSQLDDTGRVYALAGGFVREAAEFDPAFFGISPREALAMDPQQRLLLETSWEAFEDAGIVPETLRGTRTGVFAGTNGQDYATLLRDSDADLGGHAGVGNNASVLSGRVAYAFGLEGPAVTVDTACSSALVAMHMAVRSLRSGESTLALAGGVTVMATPGVFGEFARQGGLAPDGRCKAFSADADGATFSDGAGTVVLERLSDALRNGHRVLAVIRGSAVNSDGASNGLTAPNGRSQQRVIRAALADAGLRPSDVDAVEAHGTGTSLGDPIEAGALLAAYGQDRDEPLLVGSVKSNLGHTQAAAGAAGVLKVVLALRHGLLPRTLHVTEPSPHVDWSSGAVEVLTSARPWPEGGRPRRAGVSSFGISGTNAHLIVEQAPAVGTTTDEPAGVAGATGARPVLLPLSATTPAALRDQAARLLARLTDDVDPADVGFALATARTAFDHRAVVHGDDWAAGLRSLAAGEPSASVVEGVVREPAGTAFLFTGQGAQRVGMGTGLRAAFPVFAAAWDEVRSALDPHLSRPLDEVVGSDLVHRTEFTQPALFAFEVALFRLAESLGLRPEALVGHSVGEIAAAHVAGVFSLADACRLVAARGRLMQGLPEGGAMVAIRAAEADVLPLLGEGASIAAVNGPSAVVVSGDEDAVDAVAAHFARTKRLVVSHAFHSHRTDPVLAGFRAVLADVAFAPPRIPVVTTAPSGHGIDTPDYWVDQVRMPVRFADAVAGLRAATLVEIGPDGVLGALAAEVVADRVVVALTRADRDEAAALAAAVARLHVSGSAVDWTGWFGTRSAHVDLPTYAFQRRRFWPEPAAAAPASADPAEAEFWAAVDRADTDAVATALDLGGDAALAGVLPALSAWRRKSREAAELDAWRYRATWEPVADRQALLSGTWLLVTAQDPAAQDPAAQDEAVAAALAAHGAAVVHLPVPAGADRAAVAVRLREVLGDTTPAGVVSLASAGTDAHRNLVSTAGLVQALGDTGTAGPLWVLTRGAVPAVAGERPDPAQAAVWGLGRVVALEHPGLWGGLVDLPPVLDARSAERLAGVLAGRAEDQVAVRPTGVAARRLAPAPGGPATRTWRPSGTVLVTGGTGALGRRVARAVAEAGARHVVLVGRRGERSDGAAALRTELADLGAGTTFAACDVADRDALAAVLADVPDLTAVVHAAGVLDDGVVETLAPERFDAVLRAKARGAENLHELTRDVPLDAFVVFSSFAGAVGAAGQGNYAAANAFVDALAERRRAEGLPATSIAWGPWAEAGMARDPGAADRLRRSGFTPLDPERAVAALWHAVERDAATAVVTEVDWARFAPGFTAARPSPLLTGIPQARSLPAAAEPDTWHDRLAAADPATRGRLLLELVLATTAQVSGHQAGEEPDPTVAFKDLGFDSLIAVEFRNLLGTRVRADLPATLIFDHPTPRAVADHLVSLLGGAEVDLHAELARVERLLAAAPEGERAAISVRLRSLVRAWDADERPADTAPALDSATAEELFDLLDDELGK
ncbi:type I polyketide synthase [Saccharothrix longispora]|uniref:type I polyketide synthase n=1 Tax=Saccharothrix longispora TaxID=33920 RepID=UPI0035EFE4B9